MCAYFKAYIVVSTSRQLLLSTKQISLPGQNAPVLLLCAFPPAHRAVQGNGFNGPAGV